MNDPYMLLSYINTKLRDFYDNLDDLCSDLDLDKEDIVNKLNDINYIYDNNLNKFVQK